MVGLKKAAVSFALATMIAAGGLGAAMFVPAWADEAPAKEVAPIALYEFKDAGNFGKDSMGNYDMKYRNEYLEGGTGPLLNEGTLVAGGGVEFDGKFCVSQDKATNMFADVTAFTLAFEIKTDSKAEWQHYLGIGNDNNYFAFVGRGGDAGSAESRHLILNAHDVAGEYWDGTWINDSTSWGNSNTEFQKVIVTVQPGGTMNVYVNGAHFVKEGKLPKELAADWQAGSNENSFFSVGARYNGNADCASKGAVRNIAFYDFAMDATAATAWNTNGKVTETDVAGLKTIKSVSDVSFGENDATKSALNVGMTDEQMLAQLNAATATLTLSDNATLTANVVWDRVTSENGKYYAVGSVNTSKLGYANLAGEVKYELTVAGVKNIGEPVFAGEALKGELKDSMTQAEMLALINAAKVTVTMSDDSTQEVDVTFTKIEASMGVYTAIADVKIGDEKVGSAKYILAVTQTNEGNMKELLPIARYEFEDANDTGKDSMGNYNLGLVAKEGGDLANPYGTGTIDNGRLYVGGQDIIACAATNDVGDNIANGFTLNFQYQQDGTWASPSWASPISFGFNDWSVSVSCGFRVANNSEALRVGASGAAASEDGNIFWGPVVVEKGREKMHSVTLSVRPGEKFNVYVNGVLAYTADCPDDFTTAHSNMSFSIGGECVWGNGYNLFKGWIDNVSIYNFAMSLEQSNAFWQKGKIVVGDMNGEIITSIDNTPAFENGTLLQNENSKLNDRLTDTQAVRRVNKATVNAVFENEETVQLPVTWKGLKQEAGKWYLVGAVDTSNLGYATTLEGATEIKYEAEVIRMARTVKVGSGIKNGTITPDKTEAYLGDTVTFTVSPAEGYSIDAVTVNGEKLAAGADGKYTYTVTGIDDVEVMATFKEGSSEKPGDSGSNTSEGGSTGGCGSFIGGSFAFLSIAGALVAVTALRRKKN